MINKDDWYWSASRLKMMNECMKQFYHNYILKEFPRTFSPYAALGSAVHETLEHYRVNENLSVNDRNKYFKKSLAENFEGRPVDKFIEKAGVEILYSTKKQFIFGGDLVSVEEKFDIVKEGIRLYGFIDKLEAKDDTLYIRDYKTNQAIEPKLYIPQLKIYDIAAAEKFPEYKKRVESLIYLRYNKEIPYRFSDQERTNLMNDLKGIQKYVFNNEGSKASFPKLKKRGKPCSYCPLKKECW